MKLLVVTILFAVCCIHYTQAWWLGRPTGRVDASYGSGGWSVGGSLTWRFSQVNCQAVSAGVISRAGWGAADANQQATDIQDIQPISMVNVYMTGVCNHDNEADCVKDLQQQDLNDNKDDVIYNFLVGTDGKIYVGRGWDRAGQHTYFGGQANTGSGLTISFGFIGNFDQSEPSTASQIAFSDIIRCGKIAGKVSGDVMMDATAAMAGDAFYAMMNNCGGLRIAGNGNC